MVRWRTFFLIISCVLYSSAVPIHQKCPRICLCKEKITNCANKSLSELPNGIDQGVISLDLSHNNFVHFPWNFTELPNLIYLNISHNILQSINHESFKYLPNLKVLDLSHNKFSDLKDIRLSAFENLQNLTFLDFSYNVFSGTVSFSKMPSLAILKLNKCGIKNIEGLFASKNNLIELHLSHNNIANITGNLISQELKYLDLTNTGLSYIAETAFTGLINLDTIILKKNVRLRNIKLQGSYFKYLDASECALEHIPNGDFSRIDSVNFAVNKITEIRGDTFKKFFTKNILNLNLSSNSIMKIHKGAFNNISCRLIDLSFNKISYIDEDLFEKQEELIYLNMSHNFLSSISWIIKNLNHLDISFNEIQNINAYDFHYMSNLKVLKMSRNFITKIPEHTYLPNVQNLDFSRCRLRTLNNKSFAEMDRLRFLDLSNNQLTSLNPSYFPKVLEINIDNNPWRCECTKLKSMYEQIAHLNDDSRLICDTPEKVEGQTWKDACYREWYPDAIKKDNLWMYSIGIFISLVILLFIIITFRKISKAKAERLRLQDEERRAEERESLRRMQRAQREAREEANRNAPDPREAQRPPSYMEAISLPRLDASHPSLSGSLHSLASRQTLQTGSNPDLSKKNRTRRKRRRRKSDSFEVQRPSQVTLDSDTSDKELTHPPREPLESDF